MKLYLLICHSSIKKRKPIWAREKTPRNHYSCKQTLMKWGDALLNRLLRGPRRRHRRRHEGERAKGASGLGAGKHPRRCRELAALRCREREVFTREGETPSCERLLGALNKYPRVPGRLQPYEEGPARRPPCRRPAEACAQHPRASQAPGPGAGGLSQPPKLPRFGLSRPVMPRPPRVPKTRWPASPPGPLGRGRARERRASRHPLPAPGVLPRPPVTPGLTLGSHRGLGGGLRRWHEGAKCPGAGSSGRRGAPSPRDKARPDLPATKDSAARGATTPHPVPRARDPTPRPRPAAALSGRPFSGAERVGRVLRGAKLPARVQMRGRPRGQRCP